MPAAGATQATSYSRGTLAVRLKRQHSKEQQIVKR